MEDLTKTQIVLLLILVSVVVAFTSAIVTAALFEQAPSSSVTQTIQRVIEKAVPGGEEPNTENTKETVRIITQEDRIIEVVNQVSPAVVSIVASKDLPKLEQCAGSPFGNDDFFSQFFPEFNVPKLCQNGTERRQISSGTGFIVRGDGLIVTNRHVVQDTAAQYTVITNAGKKYDAKVLARDPIEDIAVLKIEGSKLAHLVLGDSSGLRTGQTVIAIGNALGEFQNTVSVGVISGLRRTVVASGEELRAVIQTDAAINPGNSGGPLLNLEGRVIGINTAIAAGAENIGFALPINLVSRDLSRVEKKGKIVYPFLGVRYQMIDEELQKSKKLPVGEGALVIGQTGELAVTPGSPAAQTGIKEGDIIIKLAGEAVTHDNTLAELIQKHEVGDNISVTYLRDGKETTVQLSLAERVL
ncbi:MAG TPA: trypsin-like peptidase domain-containing protein [Candidatus Paceibacterota bacterium]